ncbi:MAG: cyclase family protein [Pyrinomonadaceae bacterium]|nr:cyclase family protein [Pyrinomonadaceae bacterium]
MTIILDTDGQARKFDVGSQIDISIPLRFDGPQPNAFGVDAATASALGDTRDGSSVNFDRYTFIPHCNGTHTECVGHITDERISVRDCLNDVIIPAVMVSVEPVKMDDDMLITAASLQAVVKPEEPAFADKSVSTSKALIVRTLPNDDGKLTRTYDANNIPPYFAAEAMEYIVECGFNHLLVDLPSIDRLLDDGKLICHRIFWNIAPASREIREAARVNSTITELIYVPAEVPDGEYLLNLQIAPFEADCAPSRPIIMR